MRKLLSFVAVGMLSLGIASHAQAAAVGYQVSIGIDINSLQASAFGTGVAVINGSAGTIPGHITSFSLAAGVAATTALSVPVTDPGAAPVVGIQVTVANASGTFTPAFLGTGPIALGGTNWVGGGVAPLAGTAKVCLFAILPGAGCSLNAANITVPLTVIGGGAGTLGPNTVAVTGPVNVTVTGAPWASGAVLNATTVVSGFGHGPASLTSTTVQAPGAIGVKRYVTPIFISTNIPSSAVVPSFGFIDISIPEPGTLVLLGSGIAGLVMLGRARAHKS